MLSPPVPRYLVPPRSKYSPQHLILKHPQPPFLLQCQRPSFKKNYNQFVPEIFINKNVFCTDCPPFFCMKAKFGLLEENDTKH